MSKAQRYSLYVQMYGQRVAVSFHSVGRRFFIVLLVYGAKIKVVNCNDRVNVNKSPEKVETTFTQKKYTIVSVTEPANIERGYTIASIVALQNYR